MAHNLKAEERTSDIKIFETAPFSKMVLTDTVKKGLQRSGFMCPTNLQATIIPIGKAGLDLIIQSKSGTGKTLIFCTILLESFRFAVRQPQALILVPTREIAVQIEGILNTIGKYCPGFEAVSVIGGLDVLDDRKKLQTARAVVGTPGRILHLIKNCVLNTAKIELFVLDEADKLMTRSFQKDLHVIIKSLPKCRQIIACSATFCEDLDTRLAQFMRNPLLISTEKRATLLVGIKQFVCEICEEKTNILEMGTKLERLKRIFSLISFKQCLIFCNSQSRAVSYRNYLEKEKWPCDVIIGSQDQKTRLEIFKNFINFKTRILFSTDLMARGIDSENVNLVVNMDLPDDGATYLHRIGRAGRFGSHGISITFISSEKQREKFTEILRSIGTGMNVLKLPMDASLDFWNFSKPEEEAKIFGIFERVTTSQEIKFEACKQNSQGLANDNNNEKVTQISKDDLLELLIDSPSANSQKFENNLFEEFEQISIEEKSDSSKDIRGKKNRRMSEQQGNALEEITDCNGDSYKFDLLVKNTQLKSHECKESIFNAFDDYGKEPEDCIQLKAEYLEQKCTLVEKITLEKREKYKTNINCKSLISCQSASEAKSECTDKKWKFDDYQSLLIDESVRDNLNAGKNIFDEYEKDVKVDNRISSDDNDYDYVTFNNLYSFHEVPPSAPSTPKSLSSLTHSTEHSPSTSTPGATMPEVSLPNVPVERATNIHQNKCSPNTFTVPPPVKIDDSRQTPSGTETDATDRTSRSITLESSMATSGFAEQSNSGLSSGIETSTIYTESQEDISLTSTHIDNNETERFYSGAVPDRSSKSCENLSSTCPPASINDGYQRSYTEWTNIYWNQITAIRDYVKFAKYVGEQNL